MVKKFLIFFSPIIIFWAILSWVYSNIYRKRIHVRSIIHGNLTTTFEYERFLNSKWITMISWINLVKVKITTDHRSILYTFIMIYQLCLYCIISKRVTWHIISDNVSDPRWEKNRKKLITSLIQMINSWSIPHFEVFLLSPNEFLYFWPPWRPIMGGVCGGVCQKLQPFFSPKVPFIIRKWKVWLRRSSLWNYHLVLILYQPVLTVSLPYCPCPLIEYEIFIFSFVAGYYYLFWQLYIW